MDILKQYEDLEAKIKANQKQHTEMLDQQWKLDEEIDGYEEAGNTFVIEWKEKRAAARKAERKARREAEAAKRLVRQRSNVYQMGDNGHVNVKLYSMQLGQLTDQGVYWGSKEQNAPSYVQVESEDGPYMNINGVRVRLLSVNGHGEIRWTVEPQYNKSGGDSDAAAAFGLEVVNA